MNTQDVKRFDEIKERICTGIKESSGIGTLAEKTIHAVLKEFYSPAPDCTEKPVLGFVADICSENRIIEIQTRQFFTMRRKLDAFLKDYEVTIVYPVTIEKHLRFIDKATGEISKSRKSPKRGTPYAIFAELYGIKEFLLNPRLHFIITCMNVEEFRFLNPQSKSRKRGTQRTDGIPSLLTNEFCLESSRDFLMFIPYELPGEFTTEDYRLAAKISKPLAQTALNILHHLGLVSRIGKRGNHYLYSVNEDLN